MQYDVVVVGAGPAGSATARDVAKSGLKVLLVEKRSEVGKPTLCSGLVTPRTLALAGVGDHVVINHISSASIRSTSGRELSVGGGKVYAVAIDRSAFDAELANHAQDAGADLSVRTSLTDIARENGHLRLTLRRDETTEEVTTRLLIGADGVGSTVARWQGLHDSNGVITVCAAEGRIPRAESDRAEVFVGRKLAPGWFGWIVPLGDGRVRVGIGDGDSKKTSTRQLLADLLAAFPERFKNATFDRVFVKAIPVFAPIKSYGDKMMLVGDAARQVKPTSGGGIYTGLVAAKHCAKTAVTALTVGDCSEGLLARYEYAWKRDLGAELERGIDLRQAFMRLSDWEIDQLLKLFNTPLAQRMISRLGDIDSPSIVIEHIVRSAPTLLRFLHAPLRFPSRWAFDLLAALAG